MDEDTALGQQQTIDDVLAYHERSKHFSDRYADYNPDIDWSKQPNPFRSYEGAEGIRLELPATHDGPTWDGIVQGELPSAAPLSKESLSRLFYYSLSLSVGKKTADGKVHYARVNPSSGNLHPIEAYLLAPPIVGISDGPALYHYNSYDHVLEKRLSFSSEHWESLTADLPEAAFFVGVSSLHWRQVWKYGIRGYRYALLDVGHALGGLSAAAATQGWQSRIVEGISDQELRGLIGIADQSDREKEYPQMLLALAPDFSKHARVSVRLSQSFKDTLSHASFDGVANQVSDEHYDWPILDQVGEAVEYDGSMRPTQGQAACDTPQLSDRQIRAQKIIQERRSPHVMDADSSLPRDVFYRILSHAMPYAGNPLFDVQTWESHISPVFYVRRVDDMPSGLYVLVRNPAHRDSLQKSLNDARFVWQRPEGCPESLDFFLLSEGEYNAQECLTCGQEIVKDGVFAVSMLADLQNALKQSGASIYPRLFWEAGALGQLFCLEGEAAGQHARGIGCFMDDATHELLGIRDQSWQSLYHQTFGDGTFSNKLEFVKTYGHLE